MTREQHDSLFGSLYIAFGIILLFTTIATRCQVNILAMNAPQGKNSTFAQYILPHIDGVSQFCQWNQVETSPGVFNFASCDAKFKSAPGLKNVAILELAGNNSANAIPSFYKTKFPYVTCAGNPAFPVVWSPVWVAQTQPVIKAFLIHEAIQHPHYVRISFTQYGQSYVPCQTQLIALAGSVANYQSKIVGAYEAQVNYEVSVKSGVAIQNENSCGPKQDCVDYADAEALNSVPQGVGIGCGGLQKSDTQKSSSCDWINLFGKYSSVNVIRMLQSFTQTCTNGACQTGSLPVVLNLVKSNHVTDYESYYQDLECAYVPGYKDNSGCAGENSAYASAYQNARSR